MSYAEDALEEDRMVKRVYLKEAVINAGFAPDDFIAFCESGKGADIDLYTLQDLQELVSDFKTMMTRKTEVAEDASDKQDGPFDQAANIEEDPVIHQVRRERHSLLFDDSTMEEVRNSKESGVKSMLEPVVEQVEEVEAVDPHREAQPSVRPLTYNVSVTSSISKRSAQDMELHDVSYCIAVQRLPETELSQALQPKVVITEYPFYRVLNWSTAAFSPGRTSPIESRRSP